MTKSKLFNTLKPERNGICFAYNIFKFIFLNENCWGFVLSVQLARNYHWYGNDLMSNSQQVIIWTSAFVQIHNGFVQRASSVAVNIHKPSNRAWLRYICSIVIVSNKLCTILKNILLELILRSRQNTLLAKKVVTPRDDVSFLWLFLFHQSARSKDRLFGVI